MSAKLLRIQTDACNRLISAHINFKKSPKSRITKEYLETRLDVLEEFYSKCTKGHESLLAAVSDEELEELPYFVNNEYDALEEEYTQYKSSLKELITQFKKEDQGHSNSNSYPDVKLPRIQLPVFSGKYEEWPTFYDMFLTLIHENETLSPVQKLHYLKSNLTGEPEALLRNFAITDQNYEKAWKQLMKRYNNKRFNCNAILKIFFEQRHIVTESAGAIKQLLDTTSSCLKALDNMGVKTESWNAIVIYFVVSKLDKESHRQWESQLGSSGDDLPKWSQLVDFLESRFRSLEMTDGPASSKLVRTSSQHPPKQTVKSRVYHAAINDDRKPSELSTCTLCGGQHSLHSCQKFLQKSVKERAELVQSKGLCFNCLSTNHIVSKCRQPTCCKKCGRRHHTMLHFDRERPTQENTNQKENKSTDKSQDSSHTTAGQDTTKVVANFARGELKTCNVLLATAVVKINSNDGRKYPVRALLDQGSQASFVTQSTVQLLGLKTIPVNGVVSGLGDGQTKIKAMVSFEIESRTNEKRVQVNAYVLKSLTSILPSNNVDLSNWLILENLTLADPGFDTPAKIDVLLGAEVFSEILLDGVIKNPAGNFIAQNTVLGWILSGAVGNKSVSDERVVSMHIAVREDDLLRKFWEIEAEPDSIQKKLTKEEKRCEDLYEATTVRNEDGRFVVKLPFDSEDPECQYGNSREIAKRKLLNLEKRLLRDPELYEEYRKVLNEYITLNHMEPVKKEDVDNPKAVYLPHHAVVRKDKQTTKTRVVMNASSEGTNGVSLNDNLLVGPKIQQDLRHLLMRWRMHKICIVADLVKMYRQVRVSEKDADFQRILWRPTIDMPIQDYKLLTLTFGTASAPYLAVKTLQRLAEEEKLKYPIAAKITKQDFYVDDLMTGCYNNEEAKVIYEEMNELMNSGGFQLQKWSSNDEGLLKYIGEDKRNVEQSVSIKADNTLKVLGIRWNRQTDNFEYTVNLPEIKEPITKRHVLSDIARLYDPMGWIAPVVVSAKMIMQDLWRAKLDWDDELTPDLIREWLKYREELTQIKNINIPRWTNYTPGCSMELHAFSDASKLAYAAAIYLRTTNVDGKVHVSLISAKTKVAPIERELSIPRLELCGATLAAKLLSEVSQVMQIPKENLFGWTDSTIVLAWLKGGASKWTTFVSNRVSEILNIISYEQWSHVATESNPSDCASRGLVPSQLQNHHIWWRAPEWLWDSQIITQNIEDIETHEEERITLLNITKDKDENFEWEKFSNLTRMLRVISYCRRWKLNRETRKTLPEYITTSEMKETLHKCIEQDQKREFKEEIQQIKNGDCVPKKSAIHSLCPILDQNGILRVGGRIEQANVSYEKRHPIIMPAKSHLTELLISDAHNKTLHGGPQIMRNYLASKFWIIRGRAQITKCYRKCVTCLRHSRTITTQLMGQLPEVRLKPSKPFRASGVDYAGPINIRFSPGRGSKSFKGYICLFVCMVTRAVHLEVVTDFTAKGFIAAFRRFTARRGYCQDLYSDNGTNFVCANKQLREMFDRAKSTMLREVEEMLTLDKTNWHFIPPYAPNFGGLWEAGVRSTKTHLKRIIGDSTLTYEELSTVLTQVEACLNSRPITVLSDDPNDPLPLTPGHFLIGEPLINIVDEDVTDHHITGLERWKLVQKMINVFWKRWSKEYLCNLSQRYKWSTKKPEPEINDVVIIKDNNVPPSKWILGVVIAKHAGPDNVTRVVTIKNKNGVFQRTLSKLVVLKK